MLSAILEGEVIRLALLWVQGRHFPGTPSCALEEDSVALDKAAWNLKEYRT